MKRCSKCKEVKPFTDFNFNKTTLDRHHYYCRTCHNKVQQKWTRDFKQRHGAEAQRKRTVSLQAQIKAARVRQEELAAVRKEVCQTVVASDHDFLLDLHEALIESYFLRGRKNPFARIQFQEIGWWDEDTFSTDL